MCTASYKLALAQEDGPKNRLVTLRPVLIGALSEKRLLVWSYA